MLLSLIVLGSFWAGVWAVIKWIFVIAGLALLCFAIPSIYEAADIAPDEIVGPIFGAVVGFIPVLF